MSKVTYGSNSAFTKQQLEEPRQDLPELVLVSGASFPVTVAELK